MRITPRQTGTDYKTNTEMAKEINIPQFWTKHRNTEETGYNKNRMPCIRSLRILRYYGPTSRRSQGRPLKRLMDV